MYFDYLNLSSIYTTHLNIVILELVEMKKDKIDLKFNWKD